MKNKGKFIALCAALAIVFSSFGAFAQTYAGMKEYQYEALGGFTRDEGDADARTTIIGLTGSYYLQPVQTKNHPYAEAPFLEKIGNVFATIQNFDLNTPFLSGSGPRYGVGVDYRRPDFPFVIQAEYTREDVDLDEPNGGNMEDDTYVIRGGKYITDNFVAGVQYNNSKTDSSLSAIGRFTDKNTGYGVFGKYVTDMMALTGSLGTGKHDEGTATFKNTSVAVAGDYFFTQGLSAGVGLGLSTGEDQPTEGTTLSVDTRYFVTPRFSIAVGYDFFVNDNDGFDNEHTWNAVVGARF